MIVDQVSTRACASNDTSHFNFSEVTGRGEKRYPFHIFIYPWRVHCSQTAGKRFLNPRTAELKLATCVINIDVLLREMHMLSSTMQAMPSRAVVAV